ncbi:hypothetical protein PR202_ga22824 [Eleusine coracana subsp. coracana]|uniref:Uncharacterized protein n=1 Tax=Eleusine coracana subsp. coracana TaxID=191504 RepID=A0AAV5D3L7_ELECO|nr:hypothetical protein PR202_ga22824 [Eleusine coracana subsp. coracana]
MRAHARERSTHGRGAPQVAGGGHDEGSGHRGKEIGDEAASQCAGEAGEAVCKAARRKQAGGGGVEWPMAEVDVVPTSNLHGTEPRANNRMSEELEGLSEEGIDDILTVPLGEGRIVAAGGGDDMTQIGRCRIERGGADAQMEEGGANRAQR